MPIPDTQGVPPFADFEMLKSKVNEIVQKYNNLLVTLDTLNIIELNAEVIVAGSITGDKIAANAISSDKIQANSITSDKIAAGSITSDKIAANAVIADKIAANAITSSKIQADAITSSKIDSGAVTASKINVAVLSAISANLGTVTAGNITSNTDINVTEDVYIGDKLYIDGTNFLAGIEWTGENIQIYIDPALNILYIESPYRIRLNAPDGIYANGTRIDV